MGGTSTPVGVGALVALLAGSAQLPAQDESFRTDTLAPGVYALIRPVGPDLVAISNHVVILDDEGVTLVDTGLTPRVAQGVLAEIRRLTDRPVRTVINTHWHDDHVWGNEVFRDTFPDVRIVAHPNTRRVIRDSLPPSLERNRTGYADALAQTEEALRTGVRSDGSPLTDELRPRFERQAETLRWFVPQMADMRVALPDLEVVDELILDRPGREIRILHLGRGNTDGDLVVLLPHERIVASGDLLVAPIPYSFGSFLGEWVETLERLSALEADVIVPGHGEPQRDRSYLEQVQGLLRATLDRVGAAAQEHADLEGVRGTVDLDDWRDRFAHGDPVLEGGFAGFFVQPAVERAWLEVTDKLAPPGAGR
jgi:glyoxylase-like metal-dependent hydrolase (beta-lactamase superfamily II)